MPRHESSGYFVFTDRQARQSGTLLTGFFFVKTSEDVDAGIPEHLRQRPEQHSETLVPIFSCRQDASAVLFMRAAFAEESGITMPSMGKCITKTLMRMGHCTVFFVHLFAVTLYKGIFLESIL